MILRTAGYDINHLLTTNIYGNYPTWVMQHDASMVLCEEHVPKTSEELDAVLESIVKAVRGKPSEPNAAIVAGPSRSPLALQSHNHWPIRKHVTS